MLLDSLDETRTDTLESHTNAITSPLNTSSQDSLSFSSKNASARARASTLLTSSPFSPPLRGFSSPEMTTMAPSNAWDQSSWHSNKSHVFNETLSSANTTLLNTTTFQSSWRTFASSPPKESDHKDSPSSPLQVSTEEGLKASYVDPYQGQEASFESVSVGSGSWSTSSEAENVGNEGIGLASILALTLGALGTLLLVLLWINCCLRHRQRFRTSSISHVRLGSTGNLPVFNSRGTERFETSLTSLSFDPINFTELHDVCVSTSDASGLWEDAVIQAKRLPLEKIMTLKLLSSGGHGKVYLGTYQEKIVAIKVLVSAKQRDLDQINAFFAEIKLLAIVNHPRIVQFLGVAWDSLSDLSAVMEFMGGGDLRMLLNRFQTDKRPRGFDLTKTRIALQTAQALTYLHSFEPVVLHRDLKSKNILLTPSLDAKVSDFGIARSYCCQNVPNDSEPSLWMAPEVMLGERYNASADIFSFGILLAELDSHGQLYKKETERTSSGVTRGHMRVPFSSSTPKALVDLGHACVNVNPAARPSAHEVLYHLQLLMQSYSL